MNTNCNNMNYNLHETTIDANKSKEDKKSLNFIERLRNNKSITIVKISGNVQPSYLVKGKYYKNKQNIKQSQDVDLQFLNNSNKNEMTAVSSFDSLIGNNTNKNCAHNNTSNDVLDSRKANDQNVTVLNEDNNNTANLVATKRSYNNSDMHCIKDQTLKRLKEFDEILADVQDNMNLEETDALSLDVIDDILYEELTGNASTYNFQEIEQPDTISLNMEMIDNDSNDIFVGSMLETVITRLHSKIASEITIERDTDVISINSDDTPSTDVIKSKRLVVTEDKTVQKDSKQNEQYKRPEVTSLNNIEENDTLTSEYTHSIDTISISSEDEKPGIDDSCGYHSSDFEFISEEEAKDGFIINFNPERSRNQAAEFDRFQNDPYGPEPSSGTVGRNDHKREDEVVIDKSYIKNYALPQEKEFLNMFEGLPTCEIHLENKSVRTRAPMLVQYEGVGFDMNLSMQRADSFDDEYRDEAEETVKKILEMYPVENANRRRRK